MASTNQYVATISRDWLGRSPLMCIPIAASNLIEATQQAIKYKQEFFPNLSLSKVSSVVEDYDWFCELYESFNPFSCEVK